MFEREEVDNNVKRESGDEIKLKIRGYNNSTIDWLYIRVLEPIINVGFCWPNSR